MNGKALHSSLGFLLIGFLSASILAEQPEATSPAVTAVASRQQEARAKVASVFGTQTNILQVPASSFVPRGITVIGVFSPDLGYAFRYSGGVPEFAWATVTLPSGVDLDYLDLYFCDTNTTYDLTATLIGYSGWDDSNINATNLISVSSSGDGGCEYAFAPGVPSFFDHTINNDVHYNGGYQYTIVVESPVDDSSLRFKAVDIWYHRQVSPAPGTASFTDVPTSHPFFQFIEALYASGITGGCQATPPKFCPGNTITRGQMAVFMAKALGLHYPN
jgi:S-layer homology domain